MPCYDSRNEPEYVLAEARKEWRHNSPLAQMLCEAMKIIDGGYSLGVCSQELRDWWIEHKARDTALSAAKERGDG